MQAVENEALENTSDFIRRCREQGRLQPFAPAPLGEHRQRFMALVEDMRRHGADYTAQLSMLTLAGLNRGHEKRESAHTLIAELLQRTDIREKEEELLQLWQSRLLLKLGESYDLQQADIGTALTHIASRQNTLLQELREEEDNPFGLTSGFGESTREADSMLRHRLKAWCRLYFHDQSPAPSLLVTRQGMAMELLQEVYEKLCGRLAEPLVSLDVPLVGGEDTLAATPLINQVAPLQKALTQVMQPLAPEQASLIAKQWTDAEDAWRQLLDKQYPSAQAGRGRLDVLYFPGISTKRLMMEGFAGGIGSAASEEMAAAKQGCCLSVLSRP
ncbi:MAG: hypothetical protein PHI97_10975 [Desulfobulbus sp.]|nr:hypothetical protein [Desulfobulbus sp.]